MSVPPYPYDYGRDREASGNDDWKRQAPPADREKLCADCDGDGDYERDGRHVECEWCAGTGRLNAPPADQPIYEGVQAINPEAEPPADLRKQIMDREHSWLLCRDCGIVGFRRNVSPPICPGCHVEGTLAIYVRLDVVMEVLNVHNKTAEAQAPTDAIPGREATEEA